MIEAAVTLPPCLMRVGAAALGGGGSAVIAGLTITPCPAIPPNTPCWELKSGGGASSLMMVTFVGIARGAKSLLPWSKWTIGLTFTNASTGGGGGGGGGGATSKVERYALGSAWV